MCSEGEEKRKAEGVHGWWGKKKKKEIKRKIEMGSEIYVYGGKKGGVEKKKKIERKKTKLVLFVCSLCLVQNIEL